ncbi:MAG: class A beta-lactamase-related serine hydrolase [Lactobacillus sp.]|jgi:beta-lactamase class A|nr:class A beta-lactamase-related serine hydrolase [Lactobacillus sp.]
MTKLAHDIQTVAASLPGKTAIIVKNQAGQTIFATDNCQELFKSASLIKLGIAAYWSKQAVNLKQTIELNETDLVPGGVLYHLNKRCWSLHDLLDLMLSVSDNTAANVLLKLAGFDKIQAWLSNTYPQVHLGRFLMEQAADENLISAKTALILLEELLNDQTAFGKACQTAMFNQTTRSKLIGALPEDHSFNKTGELADTEHDVARICRNDGFYDCCCLSHFDNWEDRWSIIRGMNQIGALLFQALA